MARGPDPGPVIKLQQKLSHSGLILMLLLIAIKACWVSIILWKVIVMKKRGRGGRIGRSEGRSERESNEWKQSPHWGCKNMAGNELIHIVSFCVSWPTWLNSFWSVRRERMKHKSDPQYIQFKNVNPMVKTKAEVCKYFTIPYLICRDSDRGCRSYPDTQVTIKNVWMSLNNITKSNQWWR